MSEHELYQMWRSSPALQATVKDWKKLKLPDDMVLEVEGQKFFLDKDKKELVTSEKWSEHFDGFTTGMQLVKQRPLIESYIEELGSGKLAGIATKPDGSIEWDKLDRDTRFKLEKVRAQLLGMVNLARRKFGGGAINGAGEWAVFERLTHQPTITDDAFNAAFGDLVTGKTGTDRPFLGAFDAMSEDARDWTRQLKNQAGLWNSADVFRTPSEVKSQLGQ